MEWREQSTVSSAEAFQEAQRWIETVTKKKFGSSDFRSALESGVLLCDLINKIKPGLIKRVNRLPTPIAGLDNLNVFLKACGKLGLKEAQLFHPGDLQDLSTRATVKHQETDRRLKNVLITIYWLGRRAQSDRLYDGPYLNFKAFEGLLGTALYKTLQESSSQRSSTARDSGFGDSWYSEREKLHHLGGRGGGRPRRDDSLDSLNSMGSRPHSDSSDTTLKGSSEGCYSEEEIDTIIRMAQNRDSKGYRRITNILPSVSADYNRFLPTKDKPSGYVPPPLRKKRGERNEDNRRSLNYGSMEDEGQITSKPPLLGSIPGSKSTSDIDADAMALRQLRFEELQKYREQIKESDDKWQDDLTKWKNRRRSVNSDIAKKKEEREKIEQITYGDDRRSKTFKEMQEERESKTKNRISSRLASLSFLHDSEDDSEAPVISPLSRTHLSRSYTIDAPYFSSQPSEPSVKPEDSPASSPLPFQPSPPTSQQVADKAVASPTAATPASRSSVLSSTTPKAPSLQRSQAVDDPGTTREAQSTNTASIPSSAQKAPEPKPPLLGTQAKAEAPPLALHKEEPQLNSMQPKPPEFSWVSSSLPRSYQKSDSLRLTSVVTPRPFGTQSSRISSLPRAQTMDNSHQRVNGSASIPQKTSVPSRYQQFMTSEDEAQSSSAQSSEEEEKDEVKEDERPKEMSITSDSPASPLMNSQTKQENFCEMRVNLNQKPNSSRDFGFQSNWDSKGVRVSSIQPESSAEMCQLQVGDEVLTINGHKVAEMSYTEWKTCMDQALQEGSLVMDVRRHGQNNWVRDEPSLPYKSHRTINLTSTDHPTILGPPGTKTVSSSLDLTSHIPPETVPSKEAPAKTAVGVASNGVNGSLHEEPVTMRNKESEPISLKNLKRRSEFFEQGGSESSVSALTYLCGGSNSSMPDITVPAITPPSNRWTWDPEEERRRQEKWQMEQERLLQEKYMRDQQKLQEEWHKAQQDISTSMGQQEHLEVNSNNVGTHFPLSSSSVPQTAPPAWEEEERKRKEEQERQRQEEERKKREEQERDLLRLEEQRKRREVQEEQRRRQEAAEQERREKEKALEQQQQWGGHLHGFASVQQPLSFTDRAKSKSSPQLDEDEEGQRRGSSADFKSYQPLSQAELERQQILNKMKKKTSLQRDGSWIRQGSTTTPTSKGESDPQFMRRGESLDNLDYDSHRSSWSPRSNSFVQNYSQTQHGLYGNSSGYGGGLRAQRPVSVTLPYSQSMGSLRGGAGTHTFPWSRQSSSTSTLSPTTPDPLPEGDSRQQRSSVSIAIRALEDQKPGPKSEYETNSSTATPATYKPKSGNQHPCEVKALKQIDEESTCDNNP
ncbi:LIM domain only protein 7 isoform X4 [Oryzias latipes]|uniref:LIM domain only protein 7 isoform X4 n=1 Tax=Oryzias latipes TaxID=8090 RepID=UPI0009D96FD0|nr:LIM domain only protein 7 isoform X4 [Oryzias latipes]